MIVVAGDTILPGAYVMLTGNTPEGYEVVKQWDGEDMRRIYGQYLYQWYTSPPRDAPQQCAKDEKIMIKRIDEPTVPMNADMGSIQLDSREKITVVGVDVEWSLGSRISFEIRLDNGYKIYGKNLQGDCGIVKDSKTF